MLNNRKKSLLYLLLVFFVVSVVSCSKESNPTEPQPDTIPENNVQDVKKEEVPENEQGGDPRGTYYGNSPYFFHFSSTFTAKDSVVVSKAKTMLVIEGSTSAEGSYRFLEENYQIDQFILSIETPGSSHRIQINNNYKPIKVTTGTWKVSGNIITFQREGHPPDEARFSATNRGIFFYSYQTVPLFGGFTQVRAYKGKKD